MNSIQAGESCGRGANAVIERIANHCRAAV
jgi:hypothetical protein